MKKKRRREIKIAVFSDTHGQLEIAQWVLQGLGQVDLILHAGDYFSDGLKLSADVRVPVKAVLGNCDYDREGPEEELIELSGRRILLTHGHLAGVKTPSSDRKLITQAKAKGAEAVIYGHTHVAEITCLEGILLFNPGSITRPLDQGGLSYGILEIDEKGIFPAICRV